MLIAAFVAAATFVQILWHKLRMTQWFSGNSRTLQRKCVSRGKRRPACAASNIPDIWPEQNVLGSCCHSQWIRWPHPDSRTTSWFRSCSKLETKGERWLSMAEEAWDALWWVGTRDSWLRTWDGLGLLWMAALETWTRSMCAIDFRALASHPLKSSKKGVGEKHVPL